MRVHLINNSIVTNTIECESVEYADSLFPDDICIEATYGGIGWTWDGTTMHPPEPEPEPVPDTITPRQCRLQLLVEEKLDDVEAAIDTMGAAAKVEWEYALEVKRTYTLVIAMQQLFQWTDAEMDQFFAEAAKL